MLKPSGVLYFWHNDIAQCAELLHEIKLQTGLQFRSFLIWDKGGSYRAQSWYNTAGNAPLRQWFNICEYAFHFFSGGAGSGTGLEAINSNPNCYREIKDWYRAELDRLGITEEQIKQKYREVTGKSGAMFRHYFKDNQFEIPTREVWDTVFQPFGFSKSINELQEEQKAQRDTYDGLKAEFEPMRPYHKADAMHCNIIHRPQIPTQNRLHTCQKPVDILERIIKVSSRPGAVVLDCFMGSGSTGEAALNTGRDFIGIEKDPATFRVAEKRIRDVQEEIENRAAQISLFE